MQRKELLTPAFSPSEGQKENVLHSVCDRRLARRKGLFTSRTAVRYLQFGCVGGTGVLVDMAVLFLLADAHTLHWNLTLSKVLAAEIALLNNFVWNELWTFRDHASYHIGARARFSRLWKFNIICAAGIGLNVLLLNAQVRALGMDVYAANLISIFLVSLWNFGMNLKFGWANSPSAPLFQRDEDKAEK